MQNLFRLWFAIRHTTGSSWLVGEDTLGMSPEVKDHSYPLFGKVPIPPVLLSQFDIIITLNLLQPLRKVVLDHLQRIIAANKPRSWLTIYLCTFILLHNCAMVTADRYRHARKHGLKVGPWPRLTCTSRQLMPSQDSLFLACVGGGSTSWGERVVGPLSLPHWGLLAFLSRLEESRKPCSIWSDCRTSSVHNQNVWACPTERLIIPRVSYFGCTTDELLSLEDQIRIMKAHELFEDELYFVSQMFDKDWTPRDTISSGTHDTYLNMRAV